MNNTILRVQLENKAVTQYGSLIFNSSTSFNGKTLFANSTGIFSLAGSTDNGTAISAVAELFPTNFGLHNIKRIRCIDFGADIKGDLIITVTADESFSQSKDLVVGTAYDRQSGHRLFISRTVRGVYHTVKIANKVGSDFFISGIKVVVNFLSGRIS
jgi:hypothetical protein